MFQFTTLSWLWACCVFHGRITVVIATVCRVRQTEVCGSRSRIHSSRRPDG